MRLRTQPLGARRRRVGEAAPRRTDVQDVEGAQAAAELDDLPADRGDESA